MTSIFEQHGSIWKVVPCLCYNNLCKKLTPKCNLLLLIRVQFQDFGRLPIRQSTRKRKSQFPLSSQHSLPGLLVSQHFHSTVVRDDQGLTHTCHLVVISGDKIWKTFQYEFSWEEGGSYNDKFIPWRRFFSSSIVPPLFDNSPTLLLLKW